MTIRHVTADDTVAWVRMRQALWPGDPHAADIAAFFAGRSTEPEAVLVAEYQPGQPVAVVELSTRRDLPDTGAALVGYVDGLYVEPPYWAAGAARVLLRAAQAWARARGCTLFASDRDDRLIFDSSYHPA